MIEEAYAKSITLLKNDNQLLPLDPRTSYAHIKLGDDQSDVFETQLRDYVNIKTLTPSTIDETLTALKDFKKSL